MKIHQPTFSTLWNTKFYKQFFFTLLFSTLIISSFAQTSDRKYNFGLVAGISTYSGDLGSGIFNFKSRDFQQNILGGVTFSRYINKSFDATLMATFGTWGYYDAKAPAQNFKAYMLQSNIAVKYKFNNGYLIPENSRISPYVFAGLGFTSLTGDRVNNDISFPLVTGGGLKVRINEVLNFSYQATLGFMGSAHYHPNDLNPPTGNDIFLLHTVGLDLNLGSGKDADKDGIADRMDKCSGTPAGVKVDANGCPLDRDQDGVLDYLDKCPDTYGLSNTSGCPDSDKDGVSDKEDLCPAEFGLASLQGCPDADGDGIMDSKDKCPNVKGTLAFDGCPDRDGDGVRDEEDLCPDVKGVVMFKGCPDTDSDGIEDTKDMCPTLKGPVSTNGCPDTDNDAVHDGIDKCPQVAGDPSHKGCPDTDLDGVFDDIDKCITIPGTATNFGCPELKKSTKLLFQKALQGIQFETGKAIIKPVSFGILNAIVNVMAENPSYKLFISGHTDNVGDDAMNMTLSQNRASAVADYLIKHGVSPLRVTSEGYGETAPVDTNKTAKGKTRNRRVEFRVEFMEVAK